MTVLSSIQKRKHPPTDYDAEVAYLLSVISTWSYSEKKTLENVLKRKSIAGRKPDLVKSFAVKNPALPVDANGFLISYEAAGGTPLNVLCFRGTEPNNLIDVLTDALVERHIWNRQTDEWVHRGFFLSLDVLWPEIAHELSELEGDLYLTGHSLGGAIAVLAGRRMVDTGIPGPSLAGIYTFGQPMVGNAKFAANSEALLPLYRHVYGQDLVPHLPPRGIGAGEYVHFGGLRRSADKVWDDAGASAAPESCHLSEILPAFLTLITARTHESTVPLLATSYGLRVLGLGLSLFLSTKDMFDTVANLPKYLLGGRLSMDDHIPTHYLDVSKESRSADIHSESASKRSA
jgi:hypothetical protein